MEMSELKTENKLLKNELSELSLTYQKQMYPSSDVETSSPSTFRRSRTKAVDWSPPRLTCRGKLPICRMPTKP